MDELHSQYRQARDQTYCSRGVRELCVGRSDRRRDLDVLFVLMGGDVLNICLVRHDWRVWVFGSRRSVKTGRREDGNLGRLRPRREGTGGSSSPWPKRGGLKSGGEGPL